MEDPEEELRQKLEDAIRRHVVPRKAKAPPKQVSLLVVIMGAAVDHKTALRTLAEQLALFGS